VADNSKEKRGRGGAEVMSQIEAEARAMREKTARLRELRLAKGGGNNAAPGATTAVRHITAKKRSGKSAEKARPLSEWLDAQEKEGRNN
jgi:hypothetical protein